MEMYPIGIQTFSKIRDMGFTYVDKTQFVYKLVQRPRYYFLSRPRRFGKSLLLSTLEAYFQGRKELFQGLAIEKLEKDWVSYPVLRFDFSSAVVDTLKKFEAFIIMQLDRFAKIYDIELLSLEAGIGPVFAELIERIHGKTGRQLVILIDEYDKGLNEVLDKQERLQENIDLLRPFFSQLKAKDEHIRFVMITGVARFRHLTLFSGVNNLFDISMNKEFDTLCGITQQELIDNFPAGLNDLAEHLGSTVEDTLETLRCTYDNYRFTASPARVYNPISLMNALEQQRIGPFWLQTGTSQVFLTYLKKANFTLNEIEDLWVSEDDLCAQYSGENPVSLLYQTGYLTITDYREGLYKLGIPNGEVRNALAHQLIPHYMGINAWQFNSKAMELGQKLNNGDADGIMHQLKSIIASIPYHQLNTDNLERSYHLSVYIIFLMLGIDARSEIAMAGGRIDLVAVTKAYIYVFEFKLDDSAENALRQIDDKGYAIPWEAERRKVVKIGVEFSSKTRAIEDWVIA